MASSLVSGFISLRDYAGSLAWEPLVRLSQTAILSLLKGIRVGLLEVVDPNGDTITCGDGKGGDGTPRAKLQVQKDAFWVRLLLFTDMVRD